MPKERKQNVFFYQAAGNKEPKCLKLVLCQVGLHVVTTQFHLLKQARFQCLNDDVASVWLNPPPKNKTIPFRYKDHIQGLDWKWYGEKRSRQLPKNKSQRSSENTAQDHSIQVEQTWLPRGICAEDHTYESTPSIHILKNTEPFHKIKQWQNHWVSNIIYSFSLSLESLLYISYILFSQFHRFLFSSSNFQFDLPLISKKEKKKKKSRLYYTKMQTNFHTVNSLTKS